AEEPVEIESADGRLQAEVAGTDVAEDAAEAEAAATVEAILFASDKPLAPTKIAEVGSLEGVRAVREAVEALNQRYEQTAAAFRIVQIAGGYQMQSLPKYGQVLAKLHSSRTESRLSQAAMETMAVVAYRQPVLRADIEAIRGVACGEVLRGLMDKNLIRIVGRADEIGRPMLYGTTKHFLEVFGLGNLADLPNAEQLRQPVQPVSPDAPAKPEDAGDAPPAEGEDVAPVEPDTETDAPDEDETEQD
ncbi:hypothetical protein LCGC14_3082650, partial [marine sediment metagenome]